MEIAIDPVLLENRAKKAAFLQRHEAVLAGVGKKAMELRRRLFNRRQLVKASSAPLVAQAKSDLLHVHMDIIDQDSKNRALAKQFDHQMKLEQSIRRLHSTISSNAANVRGEAATLRELEHRLHLLQATTPDPNQPITEVIAAKKVELELTSKSFLPSFECSVCARSFATSALLSLHEPYCNGLIYRKDHFDTKYFQRCTLCYHYIKPASFEAHERSCGMVQARKKLIQSKPEYDVKGCVPEPPTHFEITNITSQTISVAWRPPVFTGGLDVYEYEICISKVIQDKFQRLKHREHERTYIILPPISTSQWCELSPLAPQQYTIRGLQAKTTYAQIAIRAKTENGFGGYSNVIESATTLDPTPPSRPLFLTLGLITMSSITISWITPMDHGGDCIDEFVIVYSTLVQVHKDGADSLDMSLAEEKEFRRRFTVDAIEFVHYEPDNTTYSYTIDGLQTAHLYNNIRVYAIGKSGLQGPDTPSLPPVRTLVAGKEYKLLAELQEAINSNATYIDSSFYNGFAQRYERTYYLQLLAETIKTHHPQLAERVDAMLPIDSDSESGSDSELESEDNSAREPSNSSNQSDILDNHNSERPLTASEQVARAASQRLAVEATRRKQFQYRLHQLRHHIEVLAYNIEWADDRTTILLSLIAQAEQRILDKQAELERAKAFKGASMDSIVMHGGLQHFKTKELVFALEEELDIEHFYISDSKDELRKIEDQKKADIRNKAAKEEQLVARQAALDKFETDCELSAFVADRGAKVLLRLQSQSLAHSWDRWRSFCEARQMARVKVQKVIKLVEQKYIRPAWRAWLTFLSFQKTQEVCPDGVVSVGGLGLKAAHINRIQMQQDCYAALTQCRDVSSILQEATITSLLTEGDAHLDLEQYELATQSYEKVLALLPNEPDRHTQIQRANILNRLGRALFCSNEYDKATTSFRHAFAIGEQLGDPNEACIAARGLADCHVTQREFKAAMQLYMKACSMAEDAADIPTQIASHHGVAQCYLAWEDTIHAAEATAHADALEHVLEHKVENIQGALDRLKAKLITVSAKEASEIKLERVGAIVPRLRLERIQCKISILEEEKVLFALTTLVDSKKALLKEGQDDLKRSEASDALYVDSAVFLGVSTRYTIEDFTKKLRVFIDRLQIVKAAIENETKNVRTRITNFHDRIQECEVELVAETGDLMRRVRGKEAFRCFRFNAVNHLYKDVLGRASGGVQTCVATVGANVLVYDLDTGVCMGQAVGDAGEDHHLGELTGHTKMIMSLFTFNDMIYTGGMDCALIVWKVRDGTIPVFVKRLDNFDAAIMSVTATLDYICAGTADCGLFVFDAAEYKQLVAVYSAHYRTINYLFMQGKIVVSSGADNEIRLWQLKTDAKLNHTLPRLARLRAEREGHKWTRGHLHPVSCAQIADNEIVSGDRGGRLVVWDSLKGTIRREILGAHEVAVTCLAFDTLRIISGDTSGKIAISDLVGGLVLQTLMGHTSRILDVQVDRTMLVSCSEDGSLRQWIFQSRDGNASKGYRYHILGAGETLRSLSLQYHTSINDLREWNRIVDVTKMYMGQQLLVQKKVVEVVKKGPEVSVSLGKLASEETSFLLGNRNDKASLDDRIKETTDRFETMMKYGYDPTLVNDKKDEEKEEKNEATESKEPSDTSDNEGIDDDADDSSSEENEESSTDDEKFPQISVLKPLNPLEQKEKKVLVTASLPSIDSHSSLLPAVSSGTIRLIYEMYNESFQIENGAIQTSVIDEEYALSFVMPDCHIYLSEHPPNVKRELEIEGKNVYLNENPPGTIVNLEANRDYYVYVTENIAQVPSVLQTSVVSLPKLEKDDGRGFDSCTCIEGNPCVDEYGCRDWRRRYQIATANGWKGFGLEGSLE